MMRWYPLLRGAAYLAGLTGLLLVTAVRRQMLTHPFWMSLGGLLLVLMGLAFLASFILLFMRPLTRYRRSREEQDR